MKALKPILLLLLLSLLLSDCKKGEGDPAISLRSRKARMEGNWKMDKGFTSQIIFGSLVETTYNENSYRQVSNFNGTENIAEGESAYAISFNKNSALALFRNLSPSDSYTVTGTWNFTGGVDKVKNKEQLLIHNPQSAVSTDMVYNIKELRNKTLVLNRKYEVNGYAYSEEFTFIQ